MLAEQCDTEKKTTASTGKGLLTYFVTLGGGGGAGIPEKSVRSVASSAGSELASFFLVLPSMLAPKVFRTAVLQRRAWSVVLFFWCFFVVFFFFGGS